MILRRRPCSQIGQGSSLSFPRQGYHIALVKADLTASSRSICDCFRTARCGSGWGRSEGAFPCGGIGAVVLRFGLGCTFVNCVALDETSCVRPLEGPASRGFGPRVRLHLAQLSSSRFAMFVRLGLFRHASAFGPSCGPLWAKTRSSIGLPHPSAVRCFLFSDVLSRPLVCAPYVGIARAVDIFARTAIGDDLVGSASAGG